MKRTSPEVDLADLLAVYRTATLQQRAEPRDRALAAWIIRRYELAEHSCLRCDRALAGLLEALTTEGKAA